MITNVCELLKQRYITKIKRTNISYHNIHYRIILLYEFSEG